MSTEVNIPEAFKGHAHLEAMAEVMAETFASLDISALFVYIVDNVSSDALQHLAYQFDIEDTYTYGLADTDDKKREAIKKAITLKRHIGTVYAVKEALKIIGYDAVLTESDGSVGDGHDWARFRIVIDLLNTGGLDADTAAKLTRLINESKNARSELLDISYVTNMEESLGPITEEVELNFESEPLIDNIPLPGLKLDGSWQLDGTYGLGGNSEHFEIEIQ